MKKIFVTGLLISITSFLLAQKKINRIINAKEVERIERVLAADDMRGRRIFSPEIDNAADFIASEFKAAGLQTGISRRGTTGAVSGRSFLLYQQNLSVHPVKWMVRKLMQRMLLLLQLNRKFQ